MAPGRVFTALLGGEELPAEVVAAAVRSGLPASALGQLKAALDVSNERLAQLAGLSRATIGRRVGSQKLSPMEGDRVVRYALLYARACSTLESAAAAVPWLKSPQVGLNGATPLDFSLTEVGAREVEDLLGRIEHGVYA
jgi:putative toxin-antitoxin system antitoxin component (TIGR02293 family)